MNVPGHLAELFIAYIHIKIWKLAGFRFPSMLDATPFTDVFRCGSHGAFMSF